MRNFVAKHAKKFNRAAVFRDKKKDYRRKERNLGRAKAQLGD